MMDRSFRKRLAILMMMLGAFASTTMAKADPVNDARALLLQVSDVRATGVGPTQIIVQWTDHSSIESGFRVEMSLDEHGPYKQVAYAPACEQGVNPSSPDPRGARVCVTAISNISPRADTSPRFLRVIPFIEAGGDPKNPGKGMLLAEGPPSRPDIAILGAERPTNLLCNGGGTLGCTNITHVELTWTDNSDEDKFWVMRARGGANPNFGSAPHRILPPNTTSFAETSLDYGAIFSYKVVAVRERNFVLSDGEVITELSFSDTDGPTFVVGEISPIPPPTSPSGLSGTYQAPRTATLSWSDITPPNQPYIEEDGFFIEYGSGIGDWETTMTRPGNPGQGTVTFSDTQLVPDTLRCYRVRGYRSTQGSSLYPAFSKYTNPVCLGSIPKAPTSLTADALSNAIVRLRWNDNSNAEDSFTVQRCRGVCTQSSPVCTTNSCSSGTWVEIDNAVPANVTEYLDTNTDGLTTYTYRVFAKNGTGASPASNIAAVTTLAPKVAAPSNLIAEGRARAIFLTWLDNASDETGYRIEYRHPGDDWATLVDLPKNSIQYLDTDNLGANQTRCYRVRALKNANVSDATGEKCAKTLPPQAPNGAPTNITSTVQSNTSIVLAWTDNSTNETAFRIEVAQFPNLGCDEPNTRPTDAVTRFQFLLNAVPMVPNTQQQIDPGQTGARTFTLTGLIPHTAYYFRIRAINPDGESAWGTANPPATQGSQTFPTVTPCAQTYGPQRPIYIDPSQDGTLDSTRCSITVRARRLPGGVQVTGLRVYVMSQVANSNIAHTDTLYVVPDGGHVPGAKNDPNTSQFVVTEEAGTKPRTFNFSTTNPNDWIIRYQFRRGIVYKLLTVAYADGAPYWASATSIRTDMKVVADCPSSGL